MISFAPSLRKFEAQHFWEFTIMLISVIGFGVVLYLAGCRLGNVVGPQLQMLEASSSP